ncbi:MAG TPA: mandelate racemase/muconate lactonizing enzyme family protein [bacterium]|nr:mandelate racemase/muconate lactonizing enzyme family protein [bacterium]
MRIVDVEAIPIKIPETEFWGGRGAEVARTTPTDSDYVEQPEWIGLYSSKIETCVIRVETDAGIVGFGEGQTPIGPEVTAAAVTRVLRPILLGEDPMQVRVLRRRMYEALLPRGHFTGYILDAIAGVDIALWDLRGKILNCPVHALLGGAFRLSVPAYVSGLRGATVDEQIAVAQDYVARGFRAIKLFLTEGFDRDVSRLRRIREALDPTVKLMVDLLWAYDAPTALRMGQVLDELGATWLEAPIHPENLEAHAELAQVLRVPVASGETDRTRYQFRRQFERRALDIAQPDVGRCGITEGRAIAEIAEAYHIPITMHTGMASAVLIAASLHLAATIPDCLYQEYQPFVHDVASRFVTPVLVCDRGQYIVPEGVGLGIKVDEAALREYAADR